MARHQDVLTISSRDVVLLACGGCSLAVMTPPVSATASLAEQEHAARRCTDSPAAAGLDVAGAVIATLVGTGFVIFAQAHDNGNPEFTQQVPLDKGELVTGLVLYGVALLELGSTAVGFERASACDEVRAAVQRDRANTSVPETAPVPMKEDPPGSFGQACRPDLTCDPGLHCDGTSCMK